MLRVMFVDSQLARTDPLKDSLEEAGYDVIAHLSNKDNLYDAVSKFQPDLVIIDTESPSRDTLEDLCAINEHAPKPIVMFTHDGDKEKIKAATKAGVSAYVVGSIPSERLTPVIDAAVARFDSTKELRDELNVANLKLSERKLVERAKGILMKQRGLDEEQAYSMMRNMAMERNVKLADLSEQLIAAAQLLAS